MAEVRSYLEQLDTFAGDTRRSLEYADTSPYRLVLEYGVGGEVRDWPDHKRGPSKECFANAGRLALSHPEYTYVEGWAFSFIPVHHAWVLDERGRIIETTWPTPGDDYLGIRVRYETLSEIVLKTKYWGLLFPKGFAEKWIIERLRKEENERLHNES